MKKEEGKGREQVRSAAFCFDKQTEPKDPALITQIEEGLVRSGAERWLLPEAKD